MKPPKASEAHPRIFPANEEAKKLTSNQMAAPATAKNRIIEPLPLGQIGGWLSVWRVPS